MGVTAQYGQEYMLHQADALTWPPGNYILKFLGIDKYLLGVLVYIIQCSHCDEKSEIMGYVIQNMWFPIPVLQINNFDSKNTASSFTLFTLNPGYLYIVLQFLFPVGNLDT